MHEQSETLNQKEKYKKVPNGTHRAEEYNNWAEKFNGGVQQQTRGGKKRPMNLKTEQWVYPIRAVKKNEKKKSRLA